MAKSAKKKAAKRSHRLAGGLALALLLGGLSLGYALPKVNLVGLLERAKRAAHRLVDRACPRPPPVYVPPGAPAKAVAPVKASSTRGYNPDVELIGEMSLESLQPVLAGIGRVMGGEKRDVVLRISSPGGDGLATLLFIDQVQDMKVRQGRKMTCVASVMAASAAAILLESPACDSRVIMPATVVLFHGVRSSARGKTGDIDDELKLLKDLDRAVALLIAPRMGLTADQYLALIDRRDWWMGAEEALARHAVDEIAGR